MQQFINYEVQFSYKLLYRRH